MSEPSRPRSGINGSKPAVRKGSAVTGPTAAMMSLPSLASLTIASRASASSTEDSHAAAAGADVNTTASNVPTAQARTDSSTASLSGGGPHR